MTVNVTTQKYQVSGININIAEVGQGKPLIFIHGWTNNWMGWTLLANYLAPYYHLYMLDLPGFGDSDRLDKYSIDIESTYINAFIKKFVPNQPKAIIGASLGTVIAANTLKLYPQLSDNLIMLGTIFHHLSIKKAATIFKKILELSQRHFTQEAVANTVKSRITAYLVEMFLNAYKFDKELVDKYNIPGRQKITGKSYVELGLSASKFHMEQFLKQINKNVLLVHGEADKYVSVADAKKILVQINNSRIIFNSIEKAGHNVAYEQPKQTALAIINFLEKSRIKN